MLQVVSLPKDGLIQKPLAHVGFKSWNLSQAAGERCSKEKEAFSQSVRKALLLVTASPSALRYITLGCVRGRTVLK